MGCQLWVKKYRKVLWLELGGGASAEYNAAGHNQTATEELSVLKWTFPGMSDWECVHALPPDGSFWEVTVRTVASHIPWEGVLLDQTA